MTPWDVRRDEATERGDAFGVVAAERGNQLWHRAPEEWELVRFRLADGEATWVVLYGDGDPEEIRDYNGMYGYEWPFDGWKRPQCDCVACVARRAEREAA